MSYDFCYTSAYFIMNVSASTPNKKNLTFQLSLREFKKMFSNTLIYESILIKIYMIAKIMNTQLFHFIKHNLKGH